MVAFQVSFGRQQGHGNEHGFSHEQREDGYVRTAEAGAERLLRQTLGIGRRHSHRTDRVSWLDCRW